MHEQDQELERIRVLCGAQRARRGQRLQRLWSGYGELYRVQLDGSTCPSVVVKAVQPPDERRHPRGWVSDRSHQRKLRSYQVERTFYAQWSARCDAACRVPALLGAWEEDGRTTFVLEDLDAAGFPLRRRQLSRRELAACVDWLAHFHARFMGVEPTGLWPEGSYWHLATRPDELAATTDPRLRSAAPAIDQRLSSTRFRSLVHGDAKVANFCFSPAGQVAAVDFQYVGGGCGMRDLAYLLSSCLDDRALQRQEAGWVDRYFATLGTSLSGELAAAVEAEWRPLLPWAWADFLRFLAGWAPQHWKQERHARAHMRSVQQALGG